MSKDLAQYDRCRRIPEKMTPEEALTVLQGLADVVNYDDAHSQADEVLCALLRFVGHEDVVEAWDKIGKWYS